jgi:hypothetical protein
MRILFILLLIHSGLLAQPVIIEGFAPAYVGKSIELYTIDDYFSMRQSLLAKTDVKADSTFRFIAEVPATQKIIVQSHNNKGFLFVQPGAKYSLFMPEKDKFDPFRPTGNQVELSFYDLDSTDINYKILGFERWVDNFVGNFYYLKDVKPLEFVQALDRFKGNVEKAYTSDTSSYFKTYVKFRIAGLDNIQHAAERNRYEKHDFYIKHNQVSYANDAYMEYIIGFYQDLMPRLSNETNQAVYEGILAASPTLIMQALGTEYTLINIRIREMVMLQALTEIYHSGDYPQTNILTVMDSVKNHSLFEINGRIAGNLMERLTELVPGGKAPNFSVKNESGLKTLADYQGKHIYLHFFDPESVQNRKELELLLDIYKRYGSSVHFVTIYEQEKVLSDDGKRYVTAIPWDVYAVSNSNSIWKNYKIQSYPQYTLLDAAGYVVMSPSLGPTPNGQYQTIDLTFHNIQKVYSSGENGQR